MTQAEIIAKIPDSFESKAQAQAAFSAVFSAFADGMKAGETVHLKDLGTLRVVDRAARKFRNPRTREEIEVPTSKTVKFTLVEALKDALTR